MAVAGPARRPRAFQRDAYLGIRLPNDDKRRLIEISRQKRRDTSNLALELIVDGIARLEAELQRQGLGS